MLKSKSSADMYLILNRQHSYLKKQSPVTLTIDQCMNVFSPFTWNDLPLHL